MYIQFKSVNIKGFQAIKSATIDFDNQGIVLVKGINNYEDNANSNGSGKSSCFESICWALFGKTSNGITNVSNRNLDNGCLVILEYNIDNNAYKIIRSNKDKEYGTGVRFYCNDNEITCKNKSDTDKLIKDNFPFDIDIFLTTIFLSQGFNLRLGTQTPSGRKERIESLTGLEDRVEEFKDYLSNVKSKLNSQVTDANGKIQYNIGAKNSILNQLQQLEYKLENTPEIDIDYDELENQLKETQEKISELNLEREKFYKTNTIEQKEYSQFSNIKNKCENEIKDLHTKLNKLSTHFCPTCNSELGIEKVKELSDQYNETIKVRKKEYLDANEKVNHLSIILEESKGKLKSITDSISLLNATESNIKSDLFKYNSYKSLDTIKSQIIELKAKLVDIEKDLNVSNKNYEIIQNNYEIANHCMSIVSKQFRTYLLGNVVNYMNGELPKYSKLMFSNENDKVKLEIDGNKLNILLGDALYETLSGGEKRKVDIILTFVQRDMLMNIVGISSNLIILDEIMDFMDESATDCALKMMLNVSNTLSSMFIISHNNYDMPFDKIITIVKDKNKNSVLE